MPVDEKKNRLRPLLEKKTTEELEDLLTLDFFENEPADVDYIKEILEVIQERETDDPEKQVDIDAAWQDFQEYIKDREETEAGKEEEPILERSCKTETSQNTHKRPKVFRYVLLAAALAIVLCGTAYAAGWNVFQALADWTAETFQFLTGQQGAPTPQNDPFEFMRLEVAALSDTPVIPRWAPEGTEAIGQLEVLSRKDRTRIRGTFAVENRDIEFTILIVIYNATPEAYSSTYQKDSSIEQPYSSGGITHYIMSNNKSTSVMWTNGCLEGHIQGNLTVEELHRMLDSIYEE